MKLGLGLGLPFVIRTSGGGFSATVFVDSVAGDDGNDGLTADTPFQTLSAINYVNSMRIKLKRGSVFRERLGATGITRVTAEDYGAGQLPVLDCTDVVVGTWTQPDAGGNPNVWAITLPNSTDIQGNFASMWEDNVRLLFQPARSDVNSTPGSFCITGSAVGNYGVTTTTFEIHTSGSDNPNTNGSVYEYPSRDAGIAAGENWTIRNLRARRNGHNNGSIAMGTGSKAYGCIAEDGVKHNWYVGLNTELYDCIVFNCDYPHPDRDGWTGFVSHETDANGATSIYERCKVVLPKEILEWKIANSGQGLTAFYAHSDGAEGHDWAEISYTDCVVANTETAFSSANVVSFENTRARIAGCNYGIKMANGLVTDPWIYQNEGFLLQRAIETGNGDNFIDGARIHSSTDENTGHIYNISTTGQTFVTRSVLCRTSPGGTGYQYFIRSEGPGISVTGCIIHGQNTGFGEGGINSPSVQAADFNSYGSGTLDFEVNGNTYDTVDDYFAAVQPTFEANSVQFSAVNIPVTDAANGDFTITLASGLDPDVFGCERFPTYETIPDAVTIAAM